MTGPEGLDRRGWDHEPGEQGGPDFPRMIEALRLLQARMTGAGPPPETVTETAETLEKLAAALEPFTVPEAAQIVGHRTDLPGRGQAMAPPVHIEEWDEEHVLGHVTFSRFYLGGNGAVHGGAIPLAFDEVMGRLANTGRPRARTAYLHVNYRKITPVGSRLRVEARFEREEGRKRILAGALVDGETVVADAEGLFVTLKPGQP
ncbi:PaaI family thioesterase [Amycolatopsis acidiphila]|nr:PaaI family thioesterase [Amycolatopsis acidiphila]UIJ63089.1 PaaI family thioesterase [Amycolatopsis acidiphila]GHG66061.1 thioesterase [Amycolatopsis acidiphila]